jgi:hypothetical protein
MATNISFNFTDGDNVNYPVGVRIEENLTNEQMNEINDTMQSLVDKYVNDGDYWDSDDALVCEVMSSFNYNWEFICFDMVINI